MPTAVAGIRREHVAAFIAAELERTAPASAATRYRPLQQLFKWLDDEGKIEGSPMSSLSIGDEQATLRRVATLVTPYWQSAGFQRQRPDGSLEAL